MASKRKTDYKSETSRDRAPTGDRGHTLNRRSGTLRSSSTNIGRDGEDNIKSHTTLRDSKGARLERTLANARRMVGDAGVARHLEALAKDKESLKGRKTSTVTRTTGSRTRRSGPI